MSAFLYGTLLQWRLDIRSRSLLVTCYVVPLLFFFLMGGIFTSVMPQMRQTLIQSMVVMGVSMGAFIGLPPSILETYGGDVKKVYRANGVPMLFGVAAMFLSAFLHLLLMCILLVLLAPVLFDAALPADLPAFFAALAVYIAASLGIGCVLGLVLKSQAKLTMAAQLVFLPSIMLSGIMFPAEMLPGVLQTLGRLFPGTWNSLENTTFPSITGTAPTKYLLSSRFSLAAAACPIIGCPIKNSVRNKVINLFIITCVYLVIFKY